MSTQALVGTINATAVNIIGSADGGIHQTFVAAARPVQDYIRDFDLDPADEFVGRQAVFEQLERFAGRHPAGYFEVVGDAGLGKTALAVEIARRRNAVAFLAS